MLQPGTEEVRTIAGERPAAVSHAAASHAAASECPIRREPATDDTLIEAQAAAVHAVCGRLTPAQMEGMRRSVEHACLMPPSLGWDRKAKAHAEIFGLLADAAGHPLLAQALSSGAGLAHYLMVLAGPAAGALTANSRKRLLAFLLAGDPGGAAHEMESHLRVLRVMGRLAGCRGQRAATVA